jgi:hypothetical protein
MKTARAASAADLKFLHRLQQPHEGNFKSKSGTRATSKSGYRFCVRSRANYSWRMIFSANRRPLRRIMRYH